MCMGSLFILCLQWEALGHTQEDGTTNLPGNCFANTSATVSAMHLALHYCHHYFGSLSQCRGMYAIAEINNDNFAVIVIVCVIMIIDDCIIFNWLHATGVHFLSSFIHFLHFAVVYISPEHELITPSYNSKTHNNTILPKRIPNIIPADLHALTRSQYTTTTLMPKLLS